MVVTPVPPFATETGAERAYCKVVAFDVIDNPVPAVGVINAGFALVAPIRSCPSVPAVVAATALVPCPKSTP